MGIALGLGVEGGHGGSIFIPSFIALFYYWER